LYREKFILSIVVVLCGVSLVAFQKYRNDLQTRMVSIVTIFQTTQAKSVIPIDKATINAFFEISDLNKQQSCT
jgi:hypothetical protein